MNSTGISHQNRKNRTLSAVASPVFGCTTLSIELLFMKRFRNSRFNQYTHGLPGIAPKSPWRNRYTWFGSFFSLIFAIFPT